MTRINFLIFNLLAFAFVSSAYAQQVDLTPKLTTEEKATINRLYKTISDKEPIRRVLSEIRRKQIADPLDQQTHEIMNASPEFTDVVLETMGEVRAIIQDSLIGHMGSASLAMPGKDGQLQGFLKQVETIKDLTPVYLFPSDAEVKAFLKPGGINAYTWSGDIRAIDLAMFDGLYDLTEPVSDTRFEILGHELGHIFFEHIVQRIALDLIFHATAKNLIPSVPPAREDSEKKPGEPGAKAPVDILAYHNEKSLEKWSRGFAREIVPHVGGLADKDPAFVDKIMEVMDRAADRLNSKLGRVDIESIASSFYKAAMGLDANSKVIITKDMQKKFEEALTRLSRSQETSCDNIGRIVTELLAKKPEQSATQAFMLLMGSKHGTYPAMLKQMEQYLDELGTPEGKAFRNVGSDHPNTIARAAAMKNFANEHEAFRVLKNPFLTLVSDYLALTTKLIQLDQSTKSPLARELLDRQMDSKQLRVVKDFASKMSETIIDTVVREVVAVQEGRDKSLDSTVVLLYALQKAIPIGVKESAIASINDIRLELGRPGRLGINLITALQKARAGLKPPAATTDTTAAVVVPDAAHYPAQDLVIDQVINLVNRLIPPSPIGDLANLRKRAEGDNLAQLAAHCNSAKK